MRVRLGVLISKLLSPQPIAVCSNPAHRMLYMAPLPCPDCHGWVERDGTVMDRATTLARYPFMAQQLAGTPAWQLPDYAGRTRGEQLEAVNRLMGALARAGLAILLGVLALALVAYVIVRLVGV